MKGYLSRISGDWASSSGVDAGATGEDADLYRFLHWVKGYFVVFIESMVIRDLLSLGF